MIKKSGREAKTPPLPEINLKCLLIPKCVQTVLADGCTGLTFAEREWDCYPGAAVYRLEINISDGRVGGKTNGSQVAALECD